MDDKIKQRIINHHDMIYKYLFKNNYQEDDYFPLAEAMINSAKNYNESSETKFTTYLWRAFINAMYHENANKRKINSREYISLNEIDYNLYTDPVDVENAVIEKIFVEDFFNKLTNKEKKVVYLLQLGFSKEVIALKINATTRTVLNCLYRIRNKWEVENNNV